MVCGGQRFFRCEPSEVNKKLRMQFICMKTEDGRIKGKIAFYCHCLGVTRQGFYWYLKHRDDPWKYNGIAEKMLEIVAEDECNDTYGRIRMYEALTYKYPDEQLPSERTVYRISAAVNKEIAKKSSEIADFRGFLVRVTGFEPAASWSQTTRSTI